MNRRAFIKTGSMFIGAIVLTPKMLWAEIEGIQKVRLLKKQYPRFKPGVLIRKGALSRRVSGGEITTKEKKSHEETLINWLKDAIPPEYIDLKRVGFSHGVSNRGWELKSILSYDTPKRPVKFS